MRRNWTVAALLLGLVCGSLSFTLSAAAAPVPDLETRAGAFFRGALEVAWSLLHEWIAGPTQQPAASGRQEKAGTPIIPATERRIYTRDGCMIDPFGKPLCG